MVIIFGKNSMRNTDLPSEFLGKINVGSLNTQDIHWFEVLRSAKNCQPILQMVNEVLVNGCRRYRRHKDLWCDLRPDLQFHQRTGVSFFTYNEIFC